ncbi:Zinc carboxypeptidase [Lentibacillus halodurans]|uniref:Zinc carboxypeptidase n=1 Tax=Lentibacillus halodurans TaxID=237679 RepID=A0A1I0XI97_9BACI|nr:M14 family metallocarboxypeptidase [Lentibacillus halodurans]SFB00397.1 Zinc carboxypeptidase [Lentibacillus halodurans]
MKNCATTNNSMNNFKEGLNIQKGKLLAILTTIVMFTALFFGTEQVNVVSSGSASSGFTPYFGQSYEQPEQVKELYPAPDVEFDTPGFIAGKENFTTQSEMMLFLQDLEQSSDFMTMETAGQSLEGRDLPLLIFSTSNDVDSSDFKSKTTIMLEGQIHGNEPAGGESMLVIASRLAKGDLGEEVLSDINVMMIPRINPDGSYYFQRGTANDLDANRDHIKLELPEVRTLHEVFNRFEPEVVISAHEYGASPRFPDIGEEGALPYHDILLAPGFNLNIPKQIRNKSSNWFVKQAHKDLNKEGFSSGPYYLVDRSVETTTITEGGLESRLDTNAYGLQPSFTILVESRGIGIGRENFERRVAATVAAHTSLLKSSAQRANAIKRIVDNTKDKIVRDGSKIGSNDKIVLDSERQELPGPQQLKVVDIADGEIEQIPVNYYSSKEAVPTMKRIRPTAYIMPPEYHDIAEKLKAQGVEVKRLKETKELTVESYKVTDKEVEDQPYQGHQINHVTTDIEEKTQQFPRGSYVFSSAQPSANLIAVALEPEFVDSYVTFNYLPVDVGDTIPIYRYMKEEKLVEN